LFPADLEFIYPWRSYQKRVLVELETHLDDDRLHIVAAPGAGKTVLGLEVARRINRRTLVLTPTLTVRNQWRSRFTELFRSQSADTSGLISHETTDNKPLSIITYQTLHSLAKCSQGASLKRFFSNNPGLLVLDEAHHLRNEWWQSITNLTATLNDVRIVALTATPPLDVSAREWNRYFRLCGPIDAQISIPELVRAGELCPHQDYVYLCLPSADNKSFLEKFHGDIEKTRDLLVNSRTAHLAVLGHPWIGCPDRHMDEILENPDLFMAQLAYLSTSGHNVGARMKTVGPQLPEPVFDDRLLELLMNDMVLKHTGMYTFSEPLVGSLIRELDARRFAVRGRIMISENERVAKHLRKSRSKLAGIEQIYRHERNRLRDNTRMVVLASYIRKEFLNWDKETGSEIDRMGVIPIFLVLTADLPANDICALTGSIALIPRPLLPLV